MLPILTGVRMGRLDGFSGSQPFSLDILAVSDRILRNRPARAEVRDPKHVACERMHKDLAGGQSVQSHLSPCGGCCTKLD